MLSSNSTPILDILMWTIIGIGSLVSLLGNGFITVVQVHQWLQNRKMMPCDFLLISLSTSRFLVQLESSVNHLLHSINSEAYVYSYKTPVLDVVWILFNMASLWSATWLSIFYCVKVTNFADGFFLWLKPRINILAPRLLGISIVISSSFLLPAMVEYLGDKKSSNLTDTLPKNATQSEVYSDSFIIFLALLVTFVSINLSLSVIASTLLLVSLWKHTRNLKKSGVGSNDLSTQVHINVITSLLVYLFLCLLYFSSMVIYASGVMMCSETARLVVTLLSTTYPSIHSIILIWTNPKLKEMAVHILNIR